MYDLTADGTDEKQRFETILAEYFKKFQGELVNLASLSDQNPEAV